MKAFGDLIKENIISFQNSLLDNYYKLGLDETECLVLLKLQQYLNNNNCYLNTSEICKNTSLNNSDFSNIVLNLVKKDFIKLEFDESYGLEKFSLDGCYKQLGFLLEGDEASLDEKKNELLMRDAVENVEQALNKILSPIELNIIRRWIYEKKYKTIDINDAINKVATRKIKSVNAIDRLLFQKYNETDNVNTSSEAIELFNKLYGKK